MPTFANWLLYRERVVKAVMIKWWRWWYLVTGDDFDEVKINIYVSVTMMMYCLRQWYTHYTHGVSGLGVGTKRVMPNSLANCLLYKEGGEGSDDKLMLMLWQLLYLSWPVMVVIYILKFYTVHFVHCHQMLRTSVAEYIPSFHWMVRLNWVWFDNLMAKATAMAVAIWQWR